MDAAAPDLLADSRTEVGFAPLSGEGAARTGGRFNEIGVPALYMAFSHETAVREYEQDLG